MIAPAPAGHGPPLLRAVARRSPEDFRVDERLAVELDGAGEHLWLRLEKRSLDTADVAALLERAYRVGSADVGLSGLKDRHAVTRQWFSVRTPHDGAPLAAALAARTTAGAGEADGSSLALLEAVRHSRKLRRGTHVANAFEITLRDVVVDAADGAFDERLERLRAVGFPNYLGPQRFGRDGCNVERARAWFRQPRRRTSRLQRGLWLSAVRGFLFNRVCAARVAGGSWSTLLEGEPVALDGSRSFFLHDGADDGADDGPGLGDDAAAAALTTRLARGDVHPSGPWWGRGRSPARGACEAFERAALEGTEELREGLERAGLAQERRALRALPRELVASRPDATSLRLSFALAPGVFATTLLAELGDCAVEGLR